MAHYRNTYKPARFFFLDVRVGIVVLFTMMHVRFYTIALDIVIIALAWYVERLGMTVPGAARAFRAWMAGPYRPALPVHKVRQKVDFERVRMAWEPERLTGVFELPVISVEREAIKRFTSSKAETVQPTREEIERQRQNRASSKAKAAQELTQSKASNEKLRKQ